MENRWDMTWEAWQRGFHYGATCASIAKPGEDGMQTTTVFTDPFEFCVPTTMVMGHHAQMAEQSKIHTDNLPDDEPCNLRLQNAHTERALLLIRTALGKFDWFGPKEIDAEHPAFMWCITHEQVWLADGGLRRKAACLGCGWTSDDLIEQGENTASEIANDHAFPGWRDLLVFGPRPDKGRSPAETKAYEEWANAVRAIATLTYPEGWIDTGFAPVRSRRPYSPYGGRHVPISHNPLGIGYLMAEIEEVEDAA